MPSPTPVRRLQDFGYRIPDDLAFAQLILNPKNPRHTSGILPADPLAGATAVELWDTMIRHGETGKPTQRRLTIIDAVWYEGLTTPSRT